MGGSKSENTNIGRESVKVKQEKCTFSFWMKKGEACRAKYVLMLCRQTTEERSEAQSWRPNQLQVLL